MLLLKLTLTSYYALARQLSLLTDMIQNVMPILYAAVSTQAAALSRRSWLITTSLIKLKQLRNR